MIFSSSWRNHCIDFKIQEKQQEKNKVKEIWKWCKIRNKERVSFEQTEGNRIGSNYEVNMGHNENEEFYTNHLKEKVREEGELCSISTGLMGRTQASCPNSSKGHSISCWWFILSLTEIGLLPSCSFLLSLLFALIGIVKWHCYCCNLFV